MASVITTAGVTRMDELAGNEEALVIDRMVLALIPDLDTSVADPDQQLPDPSYIVHTYEIPSDFKGYVAPDQVVYSMILGTDVGDFSFNWVGMLEAVTDTVITVTVTPEVAKWATDLSSNTTGNNLTRNVILAYQDAQNLTGISVAAETWQFDFQAEINAHINTIVDPTQEGTSPKHLTDSQAKVWQDHSSNADMHVTAAQKTTWNAHAENTSNPHSVTKAQVGLGNLPNAKSDSITLDSSDTLATSKAVKAENDALAAHVNNKNNPHAVPMTASLRGTRTAIGTWTLYGLTIGKPLHLGVRDTDGNDGRYASFRIISGAEIARGESNGNNFSMGQSGSWQDGNPGGVTTIPTATTVAIYFESINGVIVYAYQ